MIPREGSLVSSGECADRPMSIGDVLIAAPGTLLGYELEGRASVKTLLFDTAGLVKHLFWQHLDVTPEWRWWGSVGRRRGVVFARCGGGVRRCAPTRWPGASCPPRPAQDQRLAWAVEEPQAGKLV